MQHSCASKAAQNLFTPQADPDVSQPPTMQEIAALVELLANRLVPFGVQKIKIGPFRSLSNRWVVVDLSDRHSAMHFANSSLSEYTCSTLRNELSRPRTISLREALASNKLDEFVRQEQQLGTALTSGSDFERALALLSWKRCVKIASDEGAAQRLMRTKVA